MPLYEGQCHCGQTAWTAEIPEERHVLCHCGACKLMGGGEFTLNQVIPKANFTLTKGELKVYTYKADSGESCQRNFTGRRVKLLEADLANVR